jgi:hypothetical protein
MDINSDGEDMLSFPPPPAAPSSFKWALELKEMYLTPSLPKPDFTTESAPLLARLEGKQLKGEYLAGPDFSQYELLTEMKTLPSDKLCGKRVRKWLYKRPQYNAQYIAECDQCRPG